IYEDRQLSYQELNRRANQLGHYLQRQGAGPEVRVGICLERGLEMIVGVLGVLEAGSSYLPLDLAYPSERLSLMLSDAEASIVLTRESLLQQLPRPQAKVICLDREWRSIEAESPGEVESGAVGESEAYLIYTSGSTGMPKGVSLPHRALRNLLEWHRSRMLGGVKTLQFASLSFDASFLEIFMAWTTGGTVVLIPEAMRFDVRQLSEYIVEKEIEKLILPVVVLQQMAEHFVEKKIDLRVVKEVTSVGEQLQITGPMVEMFRVLK